MSETGEWSARDEAFLRRALRLARLGTGQTHPNPMVGAVVVKDGLVVGTGFHRYAALRHAERIALEQAGERARGADLYVTLEPCSHHGRTPPCAEAVAAAGIRRVFLGMPDPNPLVSGRGAAFLRERGVAVFAAPDDGPFRRLNEAFAKHVTTGLPWVTLKAGLSLDGRIAPRHGSARWVTGAAARARGHFLRFSHDAILAGIGTVLADDPELTCRHKRAKDTPLLRVVLDSGARTPVGSKLVATAGAVPLLVFVSAEADGRRVAALRERGADVMALPAGGAAGLPLGEALRELGRRGVASVLVEGGGRVHASFLAAGLADAAEFFLAPLLLGGDGTPAVGALGELSSLARCPRLTFRWVRPLGDDVWLRGTFR